MTTGRNLYWGATYLCLGLVQKSVSQCSMDLQITSNLKKHLYLQNNEHSAWIGLGIKRKDTSSAKQLTKYVFQ